MNVSKDWKAKLETVSSFMLKYTKITVCDNIKEGLSIELQPRDAVHTVWSLLVQKLVPKSNISLNSQ